VFLREYLYVDVDKVRGILSQIEEGVPETAKQVERKEKDAEAKNKMIGGFGRRSIDEESIEKSLGDALFKILEDALESLLVLFDISGDIQSEEGLKAVHTQLHPGSVVRITAPARLFHPGQLTHAMVGISTAATGMSDIADALSKPDDTPNKPGQSRQKVAKFRPKSKTKPLPDSGTPEDILFELPEDIPFLGSRDLLVGIVRFVRGVISDGVHMHFHPIGDNGPVITTRLETGRRFLDSTPEVLFSRYGFRPQEWTVVGTIGHLGDPDGDQGDLDFATGFNRSSIIQLVATLLQQAGESGLIDLPTGLGFSVVPLAVYREIGWTDDKILSAASASSIKPAKD
jgi:hypothetical protein